MGQVQNEEHLCLIAVIGVERPDKSHRRSGEDRVTEWRLRRVDWAEGIARTNTESEIRDNRES